MEDMTISAYDVEVMRNREKRLVEKHERSLNRWKQASAAVGYLALAGGVVGTVVGGIFMIWQASAGPSAEEELEQEIRIECTKAGGTWIEVSSSPESASGYGTCFGPPINGKE